MIILDVFCGTGTTIIACEKTNRICFGMEIDCHYCSVIIERYCKYTDTDDITINDNSVKWSQYKAENNRKTTDGTE
jgi:DNA modification methylase